MSGISDDVANESHYSLDIDLMVLMQNHRQQAGTQTERKCL